MTQGRLLFASVYVGVCLFLKLTLKFIRPRPNRHKPDYELPIQCNITETKA